VKIAYFDCFSGVSGDMILASLLDAGMDFAYLKKELKKLNLPGYRLEKIKTEKDGFAATKFNVSLLRLGGVKGRKSLKEIKNIINKSRLAAGVKLAAVKIFENIADAEAKAHGRDRNKIHFHEIGNVDSLIDVVGAAIAFDYLKIKKVYSSAINTGSGTVRTTHGILPVPAPAAAVLLQGIPSYSENDGFELATPTGVAILKTLCDSFGPMPLMVIRHIGIAAGGYDIKSRPDILRVFIGDSTEAQDNCYERDCVIEVETNIDDMNLIGTEHIMSSLLKAGSLDVYFTPIYMKKTRMGILLTVITEKRYLERVLEIIFKETTTLGVRTRELSRYKLKREIREIKTMYGRVKIKIGKAGSRIVSVSPEYDDCRLLADNKKIPLRNIYDNIRFAAEKAFLK